MPDEDPGRGPSRLVLVVPVLVIIGAVAYLLMRNPSTTNLVARTTPAASPVVVQPTLPPIPTATPTPAPTPPPAPALIERIPPHEAGFVLNEPVVPPAPGGWNLAGMVEHVRQPKAWAPGPPQVEFISSSANAYRFRVDGFTTGESLLLDRSDIFFNIGGHLSKPRGVDIDATTLGATGVEVTVNFNPNSATTFGPSFQIAIRGSRGTVAMGTAPYVHYGRKPDGIFRLDDAIDDIWYAGPFTMYLPRDLPDGSTIQWTGNSRHGSGFLWNWVLGRPDGGWQALVMVEKSRCDSQRGPGARTMLECFGDILRRPESIERIVFHGHEWQVGQAGSEWAAAGQVEDTLILYISADRAAVLRAAGSTHP